jgi:hypothetical protein
MVGWEYPTEPREASGLDPEAVHESHKRSNADEPAAPKAD